MSSFARTLPRWRVLPLGLALAASAPIGCVPWRTSASPADRHASQAAFGTVSDGRISVRESVDRPRITTVVRDGDPTGAVAAVVLTGGDSAQSVALAAIVRERLRRAGVHDVDVAADRLGYRIRALVATPAAAATFLRALRVALDQPLSAESPELKKVGVALHALRRHPLDGPEMVPVAACTGELGEPASAPTIDPASAAGAAQLEQWRRQFHGAQRIALAVVGPASFGAEIEKRLAEDSAWTTVSPPTDPWPERDSITAYPLAGSGTPRLTVAARVGPTFAVSALAETAFAAQGPLAQKLLSSTSWRLSRTTATVRPRGACLAITVERDPARKDADLPNDAARIAAMISHELKVEVEAAHVEASVAGERVLRASDPRDAASLAAWWSHAARLEPSETRLAIALGVPPAHSSPKGGAGELDEQLQVVRDKLKAAVPRLASTWSRPVIENVTRVENGQGNFWLLLASPCGTSAESEVDAGYTALASAAAARAANGVDDVSVEPWIAQDGVGVLAHATPRPNESPSDLAQRVANAAGKSLLGPTPPPHLVTASRARLLELLESPTGPHSEPFGLLARALEPRHPAWLAPFGLRNAIVEGDVRSIELRRSALTDGPLRVAVLANADATQATLAVNTVDRWLVVRGTTPRACPPVAASAPETAEARDIVLHSVERPPHVLLGIALKKPTPTDDLMLELLREALVGKNGWMTVAFRSFAGPVRVEVRTIGQRHIRALVIEIHCADELLDQAVEQARAVLARIRQGAATEDQLRRALSRVQRQRLNEALEPRHRLAATWRKEVSPPASPSLSTWRTWLGRVLPDEAVAIVRVRPPKSEEGDAK
jgi:hypothetical protein